MATNGNPTTKQQKAIAALLSAKDIQAAAAQAGVGERTLHRWLDEDPAFKTALRAAEAQVIDGVVRRLTGSANSALNVVMVIMLDSTTPVSVRLRAAIAILDQLIKLRELNDLEQRIARLEEQLPMQ
jgi:hypothetical protein